MRSVVLHVFLVFSDSSEMPMFVLEEILLLLLLYMYKILFVDDDIVTEK